MSPYRERLPILQGNGYGLFALFALMEASARLAPSAGTRSLAWEMGRCSADVGVKW